MNQPHKNRGFTLIELMLAMGFVSALLLAIAMTVIQISNMYNSGLTYKSVNQYGGSLASVLQRDISQSSPFDVTSTAHFIPQATGGRLCVGQYSYVWNYGKPLSEGTAANLYAGAKSTVPISFVKVIDSGGTYCASPLPAVNYADAVELLNVGQVNLAIHDFSITSTSNDDATGQYLYDISFVIGTNDKTALNSTSTACLTSDDANSNPTYCAVNQFEIVARAGSNSSSTSN